MTEQEYIRIRDYLKKRYGIDMSNKQKIIEGRLENYIRRGGWKNYTEYMNAVENDITNELEKRLVDLLSTNHTYFMREFDHFEYLKDVVLPKIKEKEKNTKDVRIWCAAASSGEEPYTLAIILNEFFSLEAAKWEKTLLATDISVDVLQQAVRGEYTEAQIDSLPNSWKRKYFKKNSGKGIYTVKDEIKTQVLFRKLNLMDNFPFRRKLHVIFVRNVMIYFDENTKNKVLMKMYDCLEPGGYLFVGKTETIDRNVVPFKLVSPSIFIK